MVESVLAAHTKSAAADPEEQQLLNDVELKPTSKAAHSRCAECGRGAAHASRALLP